MERTLLPIDTIERGDILVFRFPEDPERDQYPVTFPFHVDGFNSTAVGR